MKYKQLTPEQRYQIYAYIQNDWTQTRIALELCVHKATISRELRRNKRSAATVRRKPLNSRKEDGTAKAKREFLLRRGNTLKHLSGNNGVPNKSADDYCTKENRP